MDTEGSLRKIKRPAQAVLPLFGKIAAAELPTGRPARKKGRIMPEVFGDDQDVHFGEVDAPLPDWRKDKRLVDEEDPDDELLDETPEDVIAILGFDPLEWEGEAD